MALVNVAGVPATQFGYPAREGAYTVTAVSTAGTIDAAAEAVIFVGQIWTSDGASHTINTTGSSSLGWRTGSIVFANAGTTVKVGLAALDASNGPPPRAVNAAGVITFSVSKSIAGNSGGITGSAWQDHVPDTGTLTIANGDYVAFCVQMTARGGAADVINVAAVPQPVANTGLPCVTTFVSAAYANAGFLPTARVTFSDGARGYFVGGALQNGAATTTTWNSGSATKEYGNYLKLPFPVKISGAVALVTPSAAFDVVLYSDPFGTPVAERTLSVSQRYVAVATSAILQLLFATPYDAAPDQELVIAVKPGASNISFSARPVPLFVDQATDSAGESCYAVNRASGAFAAQNSQLDRFMIGVTAQAFAHPARSRFGLGM